MHVFFIISSDGMKEVGLLVTIVRTTPHSCSVIALHPAHITLRHIVGKSQAYFHAQYFMVTTILVLIII